MLSETRLFLAQCRRHKQKLLQLDRKVELKLKALLLVNTLVALKQQFVKLVAHLVSV
jgi:hypothetical protein